MKQGTVTRTMLQLALGAAATVLYLLFAAPAEATFPGENGKIAFARINSTAGGDIYAINPDGSDLEQLTSMGSERAPAWSADGRRIAFSSARDGNPEIYVMNAQGGEETRLTNDPAENRNPSWSPDGKRIAFERYLPTGSDIYVMNADGSAATNITPSLENSAREPAWSPDGQWIAFVLGGDVQVMRPDETDITSLTNYPPHTREFFRSPFQPNWSPDGQQIVYRLLGGGGTNIFFTVEVIRSDGTPLGAASFDIELGEATWSPDGGKLVAAGRERLEIVDMTAFSWPPLPPRSPVPNTGRLDEEPDWQPLVPRPHLDDYKNASHYCKALQSFLGGSGFAREYQSHGKCVSQSG